MDSQGTARKVFCRSPYPVVYPFEGTQRPGHATGRAEKTGHFHGQRVADKEGIQSKLNGTK
jgi:hypothetical protein